MVSFIFVNLDKEDGYYSVAVIRESLDIKSLADLKGKKACFPGVGQMAGWVIPISVLIDKDIIEVKDCNNIIKTAAAFFGKSCAPNSLIDKFNPSGITDILPIFIDNSQGFFFINKV